MDFLYFLALISNILIIIMDFLVIIFGWRILKKQKQHDKTIYEIKNELMEWTKKKS